MSAGRGIMHAEYNASPDTPVHLMQLWVLPRHKGNEPRWEQRQFTPEQRTGRLLPVVSEGSLPGTLAIDQDVAIFVAKLKSGEQVKHRNRGSHAYMFLIDGEASINKQPLKKGDQARVAGEPELVIDAAADSELILLDLP